jgi:hypothetical protein
MEVSLKMLGDVENPNLKWMITRGTLMTFGKPPKIDRSKSMDPMDPHSNSASSDTN